MSFGSGVINHFLFTGSPDRVSTLSSPGARPGIRPVIQGRPAGGASHHVPVSCRLSAAGIRFSVIRFPPRDRLSSRSAHRPNGRTQTGLPRSARTSCDRGGCPLYPEDSGARPVGSPPRPAPAASQRPVPKPRHDIPPCEAPLHEASTGVQSRSPVRSSPRPHPRGGTGRRFGYPLSFAPHRYQRRTSGAGTGHRARTWNNAYDISRTSDLACSLNACDLASHGELRVARRLRSRARARHLGRHNHHRAPATALRVSQDRGSRRPAPKLNPRKTERVLDACRGKRWNARPVRHRLQTRVVSGV